MKPKAESVKKGGRKCCLDSMPELENNLYEVVEDHTAGDPMREDVYWTYLSATEIAEHLEDLGTPVCADTACRLLDELGFARRQAEKYKAMGQVPFRNEQFENIAGLKAEYLKSENPVLSMDTKHKELLGEFARGGQAWSTGPNQTYDHDYPSYADGVVIPHGLYDLKANCGHLLLGTSHDTSQFSCDHLRLWWQGYGRRTYRHATSILLLCDAGGSNNCRHYIFKEDLQKVVDQIGVPILVAHYPPHCSKYNPIEHRLFCHVSRAWRGVVFRTMDIVKRCAQRVWTSTGLSATVDVSNKLYELGRKASEQFKESYPIIHDHFLPQWNYMVFPSPY